MPTLPPHIISVLQPFATLFFTSKSWGHAVLLLIGTLLCSGGRTVCSALRVMGLSGERTFDKYHKLLNRARWSTHQGSRILLNELVGPVEDPILVAVDEHIERRRGRRIKVKGCYRDAVRSTKKCLVKCFGIKWITVMVLKKLPWHRRLFALPFMTILAPSKEANEKAGKRHKTTIDWTMQLLKQLRRWLPTRRIVVAGDGGFANAALGWAAVRQEVHLVTRLRLDARLFDFPEERADQGSRPGKKAKKGRRLMIPKAMLSQPDLAWQEAEVSWYGGHKKTIHYVTFTCLWHVVGHDPLPARIVLVKDPEGKFESIPLMGISRDFSLGAVEIVEGFVGRWNQEVTHKEVREHLGVETQRQWSDKAIARATPVLFGLYSLVLLMGSKLHEIAPLTSHQTAWYRKEDVTFSDVYREVRRAIWQCRIFGGFGKNVDPNRIPDQDGILGLLDHLTQVA
jgi:DDE superfamily endonuclease